MLRLRDAGGTRRGALEGIPCFCGLAGRDDSDDRAELARAIPGGTGLPDMLPLCRCFGRTGVEDGP